MSQGGFSDPDLLLMRDDKQLYIVCIKDQEAKDNGL